MSLGASVGPRIAVLDYGMGNLRSVEKALARVGADPVVTRDHATVRAADGVILPGVGAFPKAMANLRELELDALIAERLSSATPTLGICLGMQLLFEASSENEGAWGLGLLQGRVDRLPAPGLKVPHIGWNEVHQARAHGLWSGIAEGTRFYFVHSYFAQPADPDIVAGYSLYPFSFTCAVAQANIFAVQFHPEKSQTAGLRLLANFAEWDPQREKATTASSGRLGAAAA